MRYDRAIVLDGGRIGYGRRPLPWSTPGGGGLLLPGDIAAGTIDMLPQLAEIQRRIAPWTRLYLAPEVWHATAGDAEPGGYADLYTEQRREIGGREYYRCNGFAWRHGGRDYSVSALAQPHLISRTLYHELFHNISGYLSADAHALLDVAVSRGPQFPGEYAGQPEERKARLFECFATALDEGFTCRYELGSAEEILGRIYTGEVAREIQSKGLLTAEAA